MWVVLTTSPAHCTYAEQLECAAMFEFFLWGMFCTAGTLNAAYWMKSRMQMMFLGTTWTHDVKKHGWCGFCFLAKSGTCLSKSMTRSRWFNDIDSFAESSQLICTADQYPVAHMRHSTSPYVPPMSNRCCLDFQNPKQNLCRCLFLKGVLCFWFSTSLPKAYFLAAVYFVCDVWQCLAPHFGGFSSRLTTSFCSIDGTPKCKAHSSYLVEQPMLSVLIWFTLWIGIFWCPAHAKACPSMTSLMRRLPAKAADRIQLQRT